MSFTIKRNFVVLLSKKNCEYKFTILFTKQNNKIFQLFNFTFNF